MPSPPPSPSPERTRLAATLRELKDRTGLSLAGLAERTTYSKSSWDRYLNGKALPPRQAVQELCALAREPEGRCLALWEIAESEWSLRAADAPSTTTPPPPRPPPPVEDTRTRTDTGHRRTTIRAALVSACAAMAGIVAAAVLLPGPDNNEPQTSSSPASAPASPAAARCRGAACEGQDPWNMNCGSPPETLLEHRTATGAWMSVRYDKQCGASWARTWHTSVGDRIEVTAGGATYSAEIKDDIDAKNYVYTAMTATRPGTTVRVCFEPATNGERECVDSRVP
ncbi:helix-turn-helix domain-containing protein [Streptomyces sp. NPDC002680]|uniref:helix-turn-helix domain-containing protein n=1 Tax=Streptomyces sp. NPDC002680 TaxID=3364659 RepID=UPI003687D6BD